MPATDATSFRTRSLCVVCQGKEHSTIQKCGFLDPPVRNFLETYYAGAVDRSLLENADYEIVQCTRCGFLWQKHILSEAGLRMLYEQWIGPQESKAKRREADAALSVAYAREMMIVSKLTGKTPPATSVLDFGMGWGYWCLMAKAFRFAVSGMELSEERRAHAFSLGIPSLQLSELQPHQFDFVNSEQTFEHVAELRMIAIQLARALKMGGTMRIAVPNVGRTIARLKRSDWNAEKDAFHPLEHINCFTHGTLLQFGRNLGLERINRPLFPLVADTIPTFFRSILAPLYYRTVGTILYFRKVREPPEE